MTDFNEEMGGQLVSVMQFVCISVLTRRWSNALFYPVLSLNHSNALPFANNLYVFHISFNKFACFTWRVIGSMCKNMKSSVATSEAKKSIRSREQTKQNEKKIKPEMRWTWKKQKTRKNGKRAVSTVCSRTINWCVCFSLRERCHVICSLFIDNCLLM